MLIVAVFRGNTQEVHFSQIRQAPVLNNPAHTGNFSGKIRFLNNYRNQWRFLDFPYNTMNIGIDTKTKFLNENIGTGIFFVNDNSGSSQLTNNKLFFSTSWQKYLGSNHLAFGIQIGYIFKKLNNGNISFPEQYDPGTGVFDPNGINNETDIRDWNGHLDFNAGFLWRKKFYRLLPEVSFSVNHINLPKSSFIIDKTWPRTPLAYNLSINTTYDLHDALHLKPGIWISTNGRYRELIAGSELLQDWPENDLGLRNVGLGLFHRSNMIYNFDAIIIMLHLHISDFNLGISYDMNLSSLHEVSNFYGAFEISLIYIRRTKSELNIVTPCEIL